MAARASSADAFSNSTSPESRPWICSCASTLKVASNRFRRASSLEDMIVIVVKAGFVLHLELFDQPLEFLPQLVEAVRGDLRLLRPGHVLQAGLPDVVHRHRH